VKKAIIKLESNKISLVLLETKNNVYYNIIDEFTDNLSLGKEVYSDGILKPVMVKDLLKVLKMYRRICDRNGITEIYAFSTKFLLSAKNNKSVTEEIYNTCGFSFTILTSEEQMKLVFTGAINSCDVPKGFFFYVGEKESYVVQFNRRNILNSAILPFGTDDVSKHYHDNKEEENKDFNENFGLEIDKLSFLKTTDEETQYLAAGNIMSVIGKIARKATRYPLEIENGYILNTDSFKNVYKLLEDLGHDKTKKIKGMGSESTDEILAGAKIAKKLIECMQTNEVTISSDDLLDGYIATVVLPEINNRPLSDMLAYSLENINAFFSTPGSNNLKVYDLCINVFKQLKVIHKLPRIYVKPLRIAGFMYDCGKRIDFFNYKKNGFEVILNSKIKGVSQKDLLLAAFACKFQNLDNFNLTDWVRYSNIVSEEDLDAVKKIGVLIELSSALDASKSSAVDDLACDILGDSIIVKTIVNKDADFEIKEAMKVNNNFKKVFTKFVEII
jgi:exopolyphosphatase/guanosine-5'-triphosphate,3'-diphosphate pyrophosphatase